MCAVAKFGAMVTDLKGKVGGQVFTGTKAGTSMQNKTNSNPSAKNGTKLSKADAGRVINTQANQTASINTWKLLSDADRQTWNAGAINFPFVNKYGEAYTPSGYQLFISVNNNLQAIGENIRLTCPIPSDLENTPPFTLTFSATAGSRITMHSSNVTGYTMIVFASAPQSAGRSFEPGRMKAIAILDDTTTFPKSLDTAYINVFGTISAGATIWVETKLSKADAGRTSLPYRAVGVTS